MWKLKIWILSEIITRIQSQYVAEILDDSTLKAIKMVKKIKTGFNFEEEMCTLDGPRVAGGRAVCLFAAVKLLDLDHVVLRRWLFLFFLRQHETN